MTTPAGADLRPNFFIVGAPKAGTTSMHDYLGQHPQIFMSAAKAPGYFATDLGVRTAWTTSLDRYLSLFSDGADVKVRGESSPSYLFNPSAAARIHDFNTDARILIVLRNPIDAMQALHGEARKYGLEPERDFATALAASDGGRPKVVAGYAGFWTRYRDLVQYADQVERYLAAFPRDQVHICLYDDLVADPAGVYRGILEFLDVDPAFTPEFRRLNAYVGDVRSYRVQRLMMWFAAGPGTTGVRGGATGLKARVVSAILQRNQIRMKRQSMDPALRTGLVDAMRPGVERLAALIDRDLSHWLVVPDLSGTNSTLVGLDQT